MAVITLDQARQLAVAGGFSGHGLDVILAIAQAESGLDTTARNTAGNTPPSTDRGILQINSYWHSEVTDAQADDPAFAFRWAYPVTVQGTDFHQWSTYTGGAYLTYMPQGVPVRNIPSNDPGLVMVPGDVQTFCEWLVRRAGGIATCVESAEMMCNHVIKALPINATEDNWLADDLLARGQASANGATDSVAASQQMTRLGVPNTQYGRDWFAAHDFKPLVLESINRGMPVLFGFYAAHLAHDDWTNQAEDAGVYGHGITIFGYDSTGAIVGDPNTTQARDGNFVHYSWYDLKLAGGDWPSMVIPSGTRTHGGVYMSTPLDGYFNQASSGWSLKSNPSIVLGGGELAYWQQLGGVIGLPKADMAFGFLRAKYHDSKIGFRLFERAVMVYDPNHVKDSPPSQDAGHQFYLGHIDDPDFAVDSGLSSALGAAQVQVASLQAQLEAAKAVAAGAQAKVDAAMQVAADAKTAQSAAEAMDATDKQALDVANALVASLQAQLAQATAPVAGLTPSQRSALDALAAVLAPFTAAAAAIVEAEK